VLCIKPGEGWKGKPEEILLAYYLATKSFESGRNIAKSLDLEALLWLEKTRDIKNALKKQKNKKGQKYKAVPCKKPNLSLKTGDLQALEEIAISRVIK
jgi:tRNA threonylcarbamoyladenosine modification (KEOPS) complex Cgi121 subunit